MIRLAPLTQVHRAALIDLWVVAWSATMPQIDFDQRRAWFANHLETLDAAGTALIGAFEADALRGFVTIDPASGHLDQICVARQAQGSDVARLLLDEAKRRSPACVRLTVNVDNPRAIRFYEREGFARGNYGRNPNSGLPTVEMIWTAIPQP